MSTGKSAKKIPLARPRHKWEDNIRMDPYKIDINARNWEYSAQNSNC